MGISLAPSTFSKGGLLQDVDVEVIDFVFTTDPPEGYTAVDRVFAEATFKVLDGGDETPQYWSAGKSSDLRPSKDGYELEPVSTRTALNDNSNFSIFIQNLCTCGFPEDKLAPGRLDVLKGLQIHVVRIPAPEREGLAGGQAKGASDRKPTILVPNKILKLPWEAAKKGKGKAAGATAAAAPAQTAEVSVDVDVKALEVIMEVIQNGPVAVAALKTAALRKHLKEAVESRNAIVNRVGEANFLTASGFKLENGMVSLG